MQQTQSGNIKTRTQIRSMLGDDKKIWWTQAKGGISTWYVQPMTGFFWKCKLLRCWVITKAYNNVLWSQQLLYRRYITCRPYYHIKPHNILHKPFKTYHKCKPVLSTNVLTLSISHSCTKVTYGSCRPCTSRVGARMRRWNVASPSGQSWPWATWCNT